MIWLSERKQLLSGAAPPCRNQLHDLTERLNRFPQGAPPSELLFQILAILFNERETKLVSELPIRPFTARRASRIWKKDLAETQKVLDELASRAILVDIFMMVRPVCPAATDGRFL